MMIFVINGHPASGKTVFRGYIEEILREKFKNPKIINTSVIHPIKNYAAGLDSFNTFLGEKTDVYRNFLCDLKDLMDSYLNTTHNYIDDLVTYYSDYDFMIIEARSSYDIDYLVRKYKAISVLINKKSSKKYTNHADLDIKDYDYQFYVNNNSTKEHLYSQANLLLYDIFREKNDGDRK